MRFATRVRTTIISFIVSFVLWYCLWRLCDNALGEYVPDKSHQYVVLFVGLVVGIVLYVMFLADVLWL